MRIAILGIKGVPGHHGVEVVVDSLMPHLAEMGHDITVYGYDSYTRPMDDYQGIKVRTVSGSPRKHLEMVSHMWHASLEARKKKYDIIHVHNTDPCLLAWLPKTTCGMVATSHGQAYVRKKWGLAARTMSKIAERFFIYLPDIITSVSKPLTDFYCRKYNKNVFYIPNGITFRKAPDPTLLQKWGITPRGFLFCSAGRIERTKGIHTLLEAYAKVNPGIPLVIAGGGSGSDFSYFEELKKNKPEGVMFAGFLSGDEFYALYAHARIFAFPSEYEAMSMALLEGLSFGTPTVYSDIPENEAVANGLGFAFEVSNANSLAEQLDYVLSYYTEAVERARQAKAIIREKHNWEVIAKQYNDIYAEMERSHH